MPLQRNICEGIRIVPMLLDVPTLRRNKFRDPRFMGTRRVNFQMRAVHESDGKACHSVRAVWGCSDFGAHGVTRPTIGGS